MVLNKKGIIQNGKYKDWKITVLYDEKDTGGYYVLIWSPQNNVGFDDWFDNYKDAEKFVLNEYDIVWTNQEYK